MFKELLGEFIGTFILVFIGCGSVAVAVLFGGLQLIEVALIWGIGVATAIYAVKRFSPAHLNPAVSIAMTVSGDLPIKKLPVYILIQTIGAFLAATSLYVLFGNAIHDFEVAHQIVRGNSESVNSAMIFGEFFPNPGDKSMVSVGEYLAITLEALGTFVLVASIYALSFIRGKLKVLVPIFIGLTVTLIICFVAPYTQAGLNPARDFGPRLFAYFSGWGEAAFPEVSYSFLTVYVIGPSLGALSASLLYNLFKRSL